MAGAEEAETFDVVIVGLGPVGATLAHLLALKNVRTLVLEKEAEAYPLPRAVHFDDEVMRVFQWIGVTEALLPKLRINQGMRFVDGDRNLLLDWPRPQVESSLAWHPSYRFHQPDLEQVLRTSLRDTPGVTVRTQCEVEQVDDHAGQATVQYTDLTTGRAHTVAARYVVGCDGGRSMVRRAIGSGMEDYGFHERWLVMDLLLTVDKPELGDHSIQFCDPVRPATYARGPHNRRRWEFTILPDEDSDAVVTEPFVRNLLSPWLRPEEAEIERTAVYTFHSVIAEQWRRGRLLIAGDAAHQTPPFMGQGLCAGIRDVANLGWKLAAVIYGQASDDLLETYQSERHPNAKEFITTAVRLGGLINSKDPGSALRAAMPSGGGAASMRSILPPIGPGLGQGPNAGTLFGQPRLKDGRRMDDAVGHDFVLLSDGSLPVEGLLPDRMAHLTPEDAPDLPEYLATVKAPAVVLRPDRYILGVAHSADDLQALLRHLPETRFPVEKSAAA